MYFTPEVNSLNYERSCFVFFDVKYGYTYTLDYVSQVFYTEHLEDLKLRNFFHDEIDLSLLRCQNFDSPLYS